MATPESSDAASEKPSHDRGAAAADESKSKAADAASVATGISEEGNDKVEDIIKEGDETMTAMLELSKEALHENVGKKHAESMEYENFIIISIGTGSPKPAKKFTAGELSKWGQFHWISNGDGASIIDICFQASADMVDIHAAVRFEDIGCEKNYLRIQTEDLEGNTASMDCATKENMDDLVKIGNDLLKKPVARVNIDTGVYEPLDGDDTNAHALRKFAQMLSRERESRKKTNTRSGRIKKSGHVPR